MLIYQYILSLIIFTPLHSLGYKKNSNQYFIRWSFMCVEPYYMKRY